LKLVFCLLNIGFQGAVWLSWLCASFQHHRTVVQITAQKRNKKHYRVFFSGASTTIMSGYDPSMDAQAIMTSSGGSGGTPTPNSGSGAARTSSTWLKQQGGVQVLPPSSVSPRNGQVLPRLFKTANRDSPDEGIQDDCSTDV
jgi:hypothetical protein